MNDKIYELLMADESRILLDSIKNKILTNLIVKINTVQFFLTAVGLLGNKDIDLIILNLKIQTIYGIKTILILRREKKRTNIPILIILDKDSSSELSKCEGEIGILNFLKKTFSELGLFNFLYIYFKLIKQVREIKVKLKKLNEAINIEITGKEITEIKVIDVESKFKKKIPADNKFFSIIVNGLKKNTFEYAEKFVEFGLWVHKEFVENMSKRFWVETKHDNRISSLLLLKNYQS